ncbi:hypothetical protein VB711_24225 [Cronbergia sp. UHCC 0137]|uniref:hypothetical protein n=1 Tax=Cronbergia sp. UHCC 0137 TaxID=3110239 RepID=UPI002B2152FC|nr:hypothetical protein [Cronbergia sp. UHCC 0137]MEA5620920.1 hypothetical protein [Cronbergia sp. UHCC 0137]
MFIKRLIKKKSPRIDPFIRTFFARIPVKTAATFTNVQLAELKRVFKHYIIHTPGVNIRVNIPFSKKRFYVTLLLSKNK